MDHIEQLRVVLLPVEDADGFAVVTCGDGDGVPPVEFGRTVQDASDPHSEDNQLKNEENISRVEWLRLKVSNYEKKKLHEIYFFRKKVSFKCDRDFVARARLK